MKIQCVSSWCCDDIFGLPTKICNYNHVGVSFSEQWMVLYVYTVDMEYTCRQLICSVMTQRLTVFPSPENVIALTKKHYSSFNDTVFVKKQNLIAAAEEDIVRLDVPCLAQPDAPVRHPLGSKKSRLYHSWCKAATHLPQEKGSDPTYVHLSNHLGHWRGLFLCIAPPPPPTTDSVRRTQQG